jgi:hypothetical protein
MTGRLAAQVGPWFGPGLPDLPVNGGSNHGDPNHCVMMTLEIYNCVVATARFSEHAAADGDAAWIFSTHPAQLFTRDQAITA